MRGLLAETDVLLARSIWNMHHKGVRYQQAIKPWQCHFCLFRTTVKTDWIFHIHCHKLPSEHWACQKCNFSARQQAALYDHVRLDHHQEEEQDRCTCRDCCHHSSAGGSKRKASAVDDDEPVDKVARSPTGDPELAPSATLNTLRREDAECKKELDRLDEEIRAGFRQLEKVHTEKIEQTVHQMRRMDDLSREDKRRQEQVAELLKREEVLRRKLVDLAVQKKKVKISIIQLECELLVRHQITSADEIIEQHPSIQSLRKEIQALDEEAQPLERELEGVGRALQEKEEVRLEIEQEVKKIRAELQERKNHLDHLAAEQRERIEAVGTLRETLADLSRKMILAHGAQQQEYWFGQLANMIHPNARQVIPESPSSPDG